MLRQPNVRHENHFILFCTVFVMFSSFFIFFFRHKWFSKNKIFILRFFSSSFYCLLAVHNVASILVLIWRRIEGSIQLIPSIQFSSCADLTFCPFLIKGHQMLFPLHTRSLYVAFQMNSKRAKRKIEIFSFFLTQNAASFPSLSLRVVLMTRTVRHFCWCFFFFARQQLKVKS